MEKSLNDSGQTQKLLPPHDPNKVYYMLDGVEYYHTREDWIRINQANSPFPIRELEARIDELKNTGATEVGDSGFKGSDFFTSSVEWMKAGPILRPGVTFITGTGGDMNPNDAEEMKKLFYDPEAYNIIPYEPIRPDTTEPEVPETDV